MAREIKECNKINLNMTDEEFFEKFPQECVKRRPPYDYAIAFFECDCRTTGLPDEDIRMARSFRNTLIENNLWNQEFQNSYDKLKQECAFTISNMDEFEKKESPWG